MCFSTGKISVTTSSRVLAKRCFMDAVVKIRPCVAIQVGSSLKRPASSPAAEPASKLSRRVEHEGHGGSEGVADDTSATDGVDATAEDDATLDNLKRIQPYFRFLGMEEELQKALSSRRKLIVR